MNKSSTTVLVTGAAGHLGSHLVVLLIDDGFTVRGVDMVSPDAPPPEGCAFTQANLSDRDTLRELLTGVDIVVHTASIHPWKPYTDDQYLDANVKGTWHLYALAAEMGIDRIVLTSSIAAVGYGGSMNDWPVAEDVLYPLSDIYSYTKYTQETIARMRADAGTVRTISLRPPAFMPVDELATCMSMVGPFAVVSDIASAHVAAVRVMSGHQEPGGEIAAFEAFNTVNHLPYTAEMCREVEGDFGKLVRQCWPDAYDWLVENGFAGHDIVACYDISKAKRILGWEPLFNFPQAHAALTGS